MSGILRRGFLIGAGSLITTAFVARARAHICSEHGPLLVVPTKAEETLFAYAPPDGAHSGWLLSLGP
jgi:hypothetical protein